MLLEEMICAETNPAKLKSWFQLSLSASSLEDYL